MMNEIYSKGPIACGISATSDFLSYKGGIINDTTGNTTITHAVEIVGWGVENGTKFWKVRNSFGTYWGENGFFRIVKGVNNLGIES